MTAILVDDEPKSREVLKTLLERYCPSVEVAGGASNVEDAKRLIQTVHPDIVFLDVEMPGGNGFKLLDQVETNGFDVIFVTSYGHYAIPALRYSATDYLLKPVEISELKAAVERAISSRKENLSLQTNYETLKSNLQLPANRQKIAVHGMHEVSFVPVDEIVRMEADDNYTFVITSTGNKFHASRTLKEFDEMLSSEMGFMRVHKTHLVNTHHIVRFLKTDGGCLEMSDGKKVEVSRRKKQEVMEKLGLA